jgi:thioredoxin reductase
MFNGGKDMRTYDIIVIGGGPAGLSAAIEAKKQGIEDIIIIDRDDSLGGILNQCIHDGFGMEIFNENLTGPEYAERLTTELKDLNIPYKTNTVVLDIDNNKIVTAVNKNQGIFKIKAKALIYAAGARETTNSKINVNKNKCAGIYTAGTVQRFVNIEGYVPGKNPVILGSNNIALIMAGRLAIEGTIVKILIEPQQHILGNEKNLKLWVDAFDIPIKLGYDVIEVEGKEKITGVTVVKLDENNRRIQGTEEYIACDSLIIGSKLVPENNLIKKLNITMCKETMGPKVNNNFETDITGIFVCGNALHINESADDVSREGKETGINVARFIKDLDLEVYYGEENYV